MSRDPQDLHLIRTFGWLMVTVIGAAMGLFGLVAWVIWRLVRAIVWGG